MVAWYIQFIESSVQCTMYLLLEVTGTGDCPKVDGTILARDQGASRDARSEFSVNSNLHVERSLLAQIFRNRLPTIFTVCFMVGPASYVKEFKIS